MEISNFKGIEQADNFYNPNSYNLSKYDFVITSKVVLKELKGLMHKGYYNALKRHIEQFNIIEDKTIVSLWIEQDKIKYEW